MTGINAFRLALLVAWIVLVGVTMRAISAMGASTAGAVFFGDMAHPWRAQFNTDFGWHLLLVAAWLIYRDRILVRGLAWGFLSVMMGGIFTLAFLFVETFRMKGDMRRVILGERA